MASAHLTLLGLPLEIRDHIWSHVLEKRLRKHEGRSKYILDTSVLRTNSQVKREAERVLYRDHTFVKVDTQWEQAAGWASGYGVPIVADGNLARAFKPTRLVVQVITQENPPYTEMHPILILAEDLNEFCRHWFYYHLAFKMRHPPGLNPHFFVTFIMRNLENPDESVPMARQRELLAPFGMQKDLAQIKFKGVHSDVEKDVRKAMAVPCETATECLKESLRLKDLGNEALSKKRYQDGLELYKQSFFAIHIMIDGRERHIHAEEYFQVMLDAQVDGTKEGYIVYFKQRIRLVANVMQAYVYLEQWEEVKFWGRRSIELIRSMAGPMADTPSPNMPGTDLWGKVYFRTGVAHEQLGEMSEAREMYRIAKLWIPNHAGTAEAVDRTKLRLG